MVSSAHSSHNTYCPQELFCIRLLIYRKPPDCDYMIHHKAVPFRQVAESYITVVALHRRITAAHLAFASTCSAVFGDVHRTVAPTRRTRRNVRHHAFGGKSCQLQNQCLPECFLRHWFLVFSLCKILVQNESIHHCNVDKVKKNVRYHFLVL